MLANAAAVYTRSTSPLTHSEWVALEALLDPTHREYVSASHGDTYEDVKCQVTRIKIQYIRKYLDQQIEKIFTQPKLQDFFRDVTELKNPYIDRLQALIYDEGGFLAQHIDKDSCADYHYSVVMTLSSDFKGGAFKILHPEKGLLAFQPPKYSFLFTPCEYPHEVAEVTQGRRQSVVFFLMENPGEAALLAREQAYKNLTAGKDVSLPAHKIDKTLTGNNSKLVIH